MEMNLLCRHIIAIVRLFPLSNTFRRSDRSPVNWMKKDGEEEEEEAEESEEKAAETYQELFSKL